MDARLLRSESVRAAAFWGALLFSFIVLFTPGGTDPGLLPGADKVIHFGTFAILAAAALLRFGLSLPVIGLLLLYGVVSEFIQLLFVPNRNFDLWDMVADAFGILPVALWRRR